MKCQILVLNIILLLVGLLSSTSSSFLNSVSDEELLESLRNEQYILVLFTKDRCKECDQFEKTILSVKNEVISSVGALVVKAVSSQLVRLYNPDKEPSIVFFRHGVPLLYDGPLENDLILHTLIENKQPCVRELSDDTFEHLTQAGTGATTGDWFIFFQSTDCIDCQRLQARLEYVCAHLKTRLNVASINQQTRGRLTFKRFEVTKVPTFIYFRLGKLYRYTGSKYDTVSLNAFATKTYNDARAEPVPPPPSFQIEKAVYKFINYVFQGGFMGKMYWIILAIVAVYCAIKKVTGSKKKQPKEEPSDKGKKSS